MCGHVPYFCTTVVHLKNRVGTKSVWGDASHMWCMSKDFLKFIYTAIWGNIGWNLWLVYNHHFYTKKVQNLKNYVFSGCLKLIKISLYLSKSAIYCVFKLKQQWIVAFFKTLILILFTLMYHCVHLRGLHARTIPQAHFWKLFCSPLKTNCGLHKNRLQKCC